MMHHHYCYALCLLLLLTIPLETQAFAAKKNGKKKAAARTTKGFGAAPPTLDEVLGKFRSTSTQDDYSKACPCGTGQTYEVCCSPFHKGEKKCLTSSDVLRTRYSAFAFRNVRYVMDTTHPVCRDYTEDKILWAKDLNRDGMFDSYEFIGLEAGPEEAGSDDNESFIKFRVTLRANEAMAGVDLSGKETNISEKSRFLRDPEDKSWSYAGGEVRSEEAGLEDTILN